MYRPLNPSTKTPIVQMLELHNPFSTTLNGKGGKSRKVKSRKRSGKIAPENKRLFVFADRFNSKAESAQVRHFGSKKWFYKPQNSSMV